MKFARERGIRRETPKKDVLAMAPESFSQVFYDIDGNRTVYICLGSRTLARSISATKAWSRALEVLKSEQPTT